MTREQEGIRRLRSLAGMSPLRNQNADREFVQERIPLLLHDMDVGSCTIVGRTLTAAIRSPRIANALIAGGYRVVAVRAEIERVESDADRGRPQPFDDP